MAVRRPVLEGMRQPGDIPAVRISANFKPNPSRLKRIYKRIYNARLQYYGLARTRRFGALMDFHLVSQSASEDIEAMVHPRPGPNGEVVDIDIKSDFATFVKNLGVTDLLCSYAVYR